MDFISWLSRFMAVPIWIIGAIAFLSGIVAIYKNISEIREMFHKFKGFVKKVMDSHKRRKRRKYNETVASESYLKWQNKLLDDIYDPIIREYNTRKSPNVPACERAVCFPNSDNAYQYEAVYFKVDENMYPYPFEGMSNKKELIKCELSKKKLSHKTYVKYKPKTKEQKRFYKLMKPTISFPDNIGYALNKISFENGFHFTARACTYKMNVCTSNIMEYELYNLYLREKKGKSTNIDKLKELNTRNHIHNIFQNRMDRIFTSGEGRSALLGVQAMVFCKNNFTNRYDVLRIRRSDKVDAKSGFLQFVPSGGFSALNNSLDYDTQIDEFSVAKAILRELLEECFGEEDFSGRKRSSAESIYSDKIVDKLFSGKQVYFKFIGSAFSLVSLRHELCFLLVIEDKEIINLIRENEECSNVIQFISVDNLKDESFWNYNVGNSNINDCRLLNPTSAALWNMVQKTDFYQNLIRHK